MTYTINKKGQIFFGSTPVILEETEQSFIDYLEFLNSGGTVMETEDPAEDLQIAIDSLRGIYSDRISKISGMPEAIERFTFDGTPIPQYILDERVRLKAEYHLAVSELSANQ
jgi:hypothetical protein